jgi:transcriptional regulator with XRE-family HTH domain
MACPARRYRMTEIEFWRRARDWSQEEMARAVKIARKDYQALESGRARPTAGQRAKLRTFFKCGDVKVDKLLSQIKAPA